MYPKFKMAAKTRINNVIPAFAKKAAGQNILKTQHIWNESLVEKSEYNGW